MRDSSKTEILGKQAKFSILMSSIVLIAVVGFFIWYYFKVQRGVKKSVISKPFKPKPFTEFQLEGQRLYVEHNYLGALNYFEQCELIANTEQQTCLANTLIGMCYYMMSDYEEALSKFNMAIEINPEGEDLAYDWRSKTHEILGNYKNALEDLMMFNKNSRDKSDEARRIYIERETKLIENHANEKAFANVKDRLLPPSTLRCSEFFDSLNKIIPKGEPEANLLVHYLEHRQFDKVYKYLNDESTKEHFDSFNSSTEHFTYNLLRSSVFYLSDKIEKAVEVLKEPQTKLERIFKAFIEPVSFDQDSADFPSFKINDNVTVKFWLAKLKRKLGNDKEYLEIMNGLREEEYDFIYCELLDYFREKEDFNEFKEVEKEALNKFKDDSKVVLHCFAYYYNNRDISHLKALLDTLTTEDAIVCVMKGLVCGLQKEVYTQKNYYQKAIELDPTFYKAYVYLAEIYKNTNRTQYTELLTRSAVVASTFDEVVNSMRLLVEDGVEQFKESFQRPKPISVIP